MIYLINDLMCREHTLCMYSIEVHYFIISTYNHAKTGQDTLQ